MIVLAYIGNHKGDGFRQWAGWAIIRLGQAFYKRPFKRFTHTELLLSGDCNSAEIASSSLLDGGVRIKKGVKLNPAHWLAYELPTSTRINETVARAWFDEHDGEGYDTRGAIGSVLYGFGESNEGWFCNEACGAAMRQSNPEKQPPAGFIGWVIDMGGVDVTRGFFG